MSRPDVLAAALRALDAGRGVAIASVIGAHGSTPRHVGARMAVAEDGEQWGTVGGGKIEQLVAAAAREVAGGAAPRVVRQHLVRDLAMCCGGSMEVVLTPAGPSRAALAELASAMGPRTLLTPVGGEPMAVREVRADDPPVHQPVITDGVLVDRIGDGERAIVFGLGHVARNVGPLLAGLGFTVVVCDDGDTGATAVVPPWATRVIESFDVVEIERELGGFTRDDRLLIITRDHAIDQQLLERLIGHEGVGYLGMIGSRGKVGRFRKRLEAKGLLDGEAGAARWARLRAPIGLDLGAETPEEIAVAIAAELVALRRRGLPAAGAWTPARHHEHAGGEGVRRGGEGGEP
jgi:xanthine dehydrogenase accessory factor